MKAILFSVVFFMGVQSFAEMQDLDESAEPATQTEMHEEKEIRKRYRGQLAVRRYLRYQHMQFSDLEQLGVERGAEKHALRNCYEDGHKKCVVTAVELHDCNYYSPDRSSGIPVMTCFAQALAIPYKKSSTKPPKPKPDPSKQPPEDGGNVNDFSLAMAE